MVTVRIIAIVIILTVIVRAFRQPVTQCVQDSVQDLLMNACRYVEADSDIITVIT